MNNLYLKTQQEACTILNYGPAVLIMFSIFFGILLNRRDVMAFRDEFRREFDDVKRRLILIKADQKHFFEVTGKLDGRIDQLSRS